MAHGNTAVNVQVLYERTAKGQWYGKPLPDGTGGWLLRYSVPRRCLPALAGPHTGLQSARSRLDHDWLGSSDPDRQSLVMQCPQHYLPRHTEQAADIGR